MRAETRILLFGAHGQVGWELRRALAPLGAVHALTRIEADFSRPQELAALVRRIRPQVVVNAAAYTAVDRAESEPQLAQIVNADAPSAIAEAVHATGGLLVHYSTDYVFEGGGDARWREDDTPAPLNAYGQSKLAGEAAVRASGCDYLLLRTSWVYAARGHNFLRTMLRLAAERDALRVVGDQHGAPTGAELIADVTALAARAVLRQEASGGMYHLAAAGETTWHGFACHAIEVARAAGAVINVAPDAIEQITTAEFPTPAARPLNSRLDCTRLSAAFGLELPPWQIGVERAVLEIMESMQS